jgi:hypothetical protein
MRVDVETSDRNVQSKTIFVYLRPYDVKKILIGRQDGMDLGFTIQRLPRTFPSKQGNQTIRVQSSSGESKEDSTSKENDEGKKFSTFDRGDVVALSDSDHTGVVMKSRINEDRDANMFCINEIEMGREQHRDLERAESKEQEKERDESSSLLDDERVFSGNTDKSEVAPIRVDDVSPNKLSSKMKQFMEEVICWYKPNDEKKKSLVEVKHREGHISGEMFFHSLL